MADNEENSFKKWFNKQGKRMLPDFKGVYDEAASDYDQYQQELDKWRAGEKSAEPTPVTAKEVPMTQDEVAAFAEPAVKVEEPPLSELETRIKDRSKEKKRAANLAKSAAKGDSAAIESEITNLKQAATELPARDYGMFSQKLEELESWFKTEKDRLDTAEALEKVAHAVAQFGGAMYGMKHGVNMAGLQFDPTDWEKKQSRLLDEFRTGISSIGERRREAIEMDERELARQERSREREEDQEFRWKLNQSQQDFQREMEANKAKLEKELQGLRNKASSAKEDDKDAAAAKRALNKAQSLLTRASTAKTSEQTESLMNEAYNQLLDAGMSSEAVEDAITEPNGFWSKLFGAGDRSFKDPSAAQKALVESRTGGATAPTQEVEETPAPAEPQQNPSDEVVIVKKGEKPRKTTRANAKALEKFGWQVQ